MLAMRSSATLSDAYQHHHHDVLFGALGLLIGTSRMKEAEKLLQDLTRGTELLSQGTMEVLPGGPVSYLLSTWEL